MLKSSLPKLALLALAIGFLSGVNVFAQTSSCAVEIEPELNNGFLVKGASATAINVKSKRVYRSRLRDGAPYFASLPEGRYDLTVTKDGFKQTKETYELLCENAEEGVFSVLIRMVKGSPRQVYRSENDIVLIKSGERVKIGSENLNPPVSSVGGERTEGNNYTAGDETPPRPQPSNQPLRVLKIISKGVVNSSAISLPRPAYPAAARAVRAAGTVSVQVTIDEDGNVISATAAGGHPLLHAAAVAAAREARFRPTLLSGTPVKVTGIITYNFVAQ